MLFAAKASNMANDAAGFPTWGCGHHHLRSVCAGYEAGTVGLQSAHKQGHISSTSGMSAMWPRLRAGLYARSASQVPCAHESSPHFSPATPAGQSLARGCAPDYSSERQGLACPD
jgi:hypothetical protein